MNTKKARYTADSTNPSYHPGRCAKVSIDGVEIGYIGQIHPLVAETYGIGSDVYFAEINFTKLFDLQLPEATYVPLPKYPSVFRDLAIICDESNTVAQVEDLISSAAGKLLRSTKLFDIYRGTGIPEDKKSLAFSLELRADDRTLVDTDCEQVINKVLSALEANLGATLR
jgi:phenylalanyl-tRNA synthetase beta chain